MDYKNKIIEGDALTELKKMPDNLVDLIITSPPYYGLRNYGVDGQIGLEDSFQDFLKKILELIAELKRVLKPTGQFWMNFGDCYGGSSMSGGTNSFQPKKIMFKKLVPSTVSGRMYKNADGRLKQTAMSKCLLMQAERIAIKMIDEQEWILRNKVKWAKQVYLKKENRTIGSVMPTSVKDRFNESGEELYFFVKNKKYYSDLDAVRLNVQSELNFERPRMGQGDQTIYEQKRAGGMERLRTMGYDSKYNKDYLPEGQSSPVRSEELKKLQINDLRDEKGTIHWNTKGDAHPSKNPRWNPALRVKDYSKGSEYEEKYDEPWDRFGKNTKKANNQRQKDSREQELHTFYSHSKRFKAGEYQPNKIGDPRGNHAGGPGSWRDFKDANPNDSNAFNPNGKNLPTVWQIGSEPHNFQRELGVDVDHFAIFPEVLVDIPIQFGCPKEVCKKCGQPREKIEQYLEKPSNTGKGKEQYLKDKEMGRLGTMGGTSSNRPSQSVYATAKEIVGYKSCHCNAGFESGLVLDPFMGSGTVAVVAKKLGFNYLGIELNPKYIKIAEERLKRVQDKLL